ncbi:ankyrin repeat family protein [Turkeypox virus]|uniref:Ankyrin repeat family protein n=1 Tax=Turkeypox virus TaxID=336486 RepID=A0A0M3ZHR3_9POXV|nr:ankyrin repeat family protein [Turkeypox virus]ALA62387.1 ankyrin repeat family protein [Turkeypox virus]
MPYHHFSHSADILYVASIVALHPRYHFNKNSMLCMAIRYNRLSAVKCFIEKGANINLPEPIRSNNILRMTPLMLATKFGYLAIAELLIDKGADVNHQIPSWKLTSLHIAVKENNEKMVKFLLSKGADVNIKNFDGYTPLHKAIIYHSKIDIVRILLRYGADISLMDNEEDSDDSVGLTPFDIAINNRDYKILKLLILHIVKIGYTNSKSVKSRGFLHNKEMIRKYKMLYKLESECHLDISKMASTYIDKNYTVFDIFVCNNVCLLTRYVNRPQIRTLVERLSIYKEAYKEFLDLCIVRAELIDTVLSIMYNMFKESNNLETTWIDIPNEVQHNILEYLTNDELHILTLT